MKKLLFIVLSGLVGYSGSSSNDTKITNGTPVPEYKDASIALLTLFSVGNLNLGRCSGTIIDKYNVMTACNCIRDPETTTVTVRIGTVRADLLGGGKQYTVLRSETFCHPDYNSETGENDIGIIWILLGMDLKGSKAIRLPKEGEILPDNKRVDVYGWGKMGEYYRPSRVLLTANVPVLNNEACDNIYIGEQHLPITDKMMCAGEFGKENVKGVCLGDNGGPAMLEKTNIQYGIYAFSVDCVGSAPAAFTRVSAFIPWIKASLYSPSYHI